MVRNLIISVSVMFLTFTALPDPENPDPKEPRPIAAGKSLFLEELTWMEIRDAMTAGTDTVIVATGGVEQNGPYLVTGKHNVVLRATTQAIARKLGHTLIAPIVPFVPEGHIDPPTQHMKYPGTISVSDSTFEALLSDICSSLRTHGFRNILLIGDSGGNQIGMRNVAVRLNQKWTDAKSTVYYIPEYYDYGAVAKWLEKQGVREVSEGLHDDFAITSIMMTIDANSVRAKERIAAGKFRINGVDLAPADKTIAWGMKVIDFRADETIAAYRAAVARTQPK